MVFCFAGCVNSPTLTTGPEWMPAEKGVPGNVDGPTTNAPARDAIVFSRYASMFL